MDQNNIIELKGVELTYNRGKSNFFKALKSIDLTIRKGDFVVIFGPSGCGKSSLLNVIAGLESPDEGGVLVDGVDISGMREKERANYHRKKIGMVFQAYNLIPTLDVLDNIALPQMFVDVGKKQREARALSIMERFGIGDYEDKLPMELSGGQQQRVGISRAIVNDPDLILADEPIGNLDSESAGNVMGILGDLNRQEGKTVVMVSHNPENISWGTHIVYMKDGQIIKEEFRDPERELSNEKRGVVEEETFVDRIAERFRGLSPEQIDLLLNPLRAEIITEFLFIPFEEYRIGRIRSLIQARLSGRVEMTEMFQKFDQSSKEGGVDLDRRLAQNIVSKVEGIVAFKEAYEKEKTNPKKAELVLRFVLDEDCDLDQPKKKLLLDLIEKRIDSGLGQKSFFELLDLEQARGGVGVDRRLARKLCRKIDLALALTYAVKQEKETFTTMKDVTNKDLTKGENPFLSK